MRLIEKQIWAGLMAVIFALSLYVAKNVRKPSPVENISEPIIAESVAAETAVEEEKTEPIDQFDVLDYLYPELPEFTEDGVCEEPEIDENLKELLAILIYQEVGGNACCDACRHRVADVALNRVADERFPDTLEEVLLQKGQYGRLYWTGIKWADRASDPNEANAVQRAYDAAEDVLKGNHSELYGEGYIWQAEFPQGRDNIYCERCDMYYGK